MINIDDLFKQRMLGAEERELPGSWGRMRELLDNDEKRRPVGFFWRRAMNYTGVVLLLASVGYGGYLYYSPTASTSESLTDFRGSYTPSQVSEIANSPSSIAQHMVGTTASHKSPSGTGTVSISSSTNNAHSNLAPNATTSNNHLLDNVVASTTNTPIQKRTLTNGVAATASKWSVNRIVVNTAATKPTTSIATHFVATSKNANTGEKQQNEVGEGNNTLNGAVALNDNGAIVNTTNVPAQPTTNTQVSGSINKTEQYKKNNKPTRVTKNRVAATSLSAVNAKTAHQNHLVTGNGLAANSPIVESKDKNTSVASTNNRSSSSVTRMKNIASLNKVSANKIVNPKTTASSIVNEPITGIAAKDNTSSANSIVNTTPSTTVAATSIPERKPMEGKQIVGKQVVNKIKVYQRNIGSYASPKAQPRLDTVSSEFFSQDVYATNNDNTSVADKSQLEKTATSTPSIAATHDTKPHQATVTVANKSGNNSGAEGIVTASKIKNSSSNKAASRLSSAPSSKTTVDPTNVVANIGVPSTIAANSTPKNEVASVENTQPMPESAPKVASDSALSSTDAAASTSTSTTVLKTKKKKGIAAVEALSNMFNETRLRLSTATFAPGLTAGVNGTFFGTNNFKGFQFGFTGLFELDEHWSVQTDLKYFHRANSNYSMQDHYFDYSSNDSVTNTFTFSTLHSFELPIAFRYTAGRMSFFTGPNLVYTLRVNTGPEPLRYAMANTIAPGKPTAPSLMESDFRSRFGVGYIFGMSYQVSPYVNLDFRAVQTMWDNVNTQGAKNISDQLYKSPSLQFSIGYRFGGGSNKE